MKKLNYRRAFAGLQPLGLGSLMALALCLPALSNANTPTPTPVLTRPAPVDTYPPLDARRLYALGMIETGNNDRAIGSAGEVSRYQLMPSVWKNYSASANYRDPAMALRVAQKHWTYLASYFKDKTGRTPTDFDMYVLWNTKGGDYARKGFSKYALASVVKGSGATLREPCQSAELNSNAAARGVTLVPWHLCQEQDPSRKSL